MFLFFFFWTSECRHLNNPAWSRSGQRKIAPSRLNIKFTAPNWFTKQPRTGSQSFEPVSEPVQGSISSNQNWTRAKRARRIGTRIFFSVRHPDLKCTMRVILLIQTFCFILTRNISGLVSSSWTFMLIAARDEAYCLPACTCESIQNF